MLMITNSSDGSIISAGMRSSQLVIILSHTFDLWLDFVQST